MPDDVSKHSSLKKCWKYTLTACRNSNDLCTGCLRWIKKHFINLLALVFSNISKVTWIQIYFYFWSFLLCIVRMWMMFKNAWLQNEAKIELFLKCVLPIFDTLYLYLCILLMYYTYALCIYRSWLRVISLKLFFIWYL